MDVLRGLDARPAQPRPTVVTVGKFAVVHRGHRALLDRVHEEAARLRAAPAVVTFDRDPLRTIAPERAPACHLATLEQRLGQFETAGIEMALVLEFTRAVANLEPEEFAVRTLAHALGARKVIVGEDFRFGHDRRGDIPLLEALGREHGFEVEALRLVEDHEHKVSSSEIREMVLDGRVDEAARLMGRGYRLSGVVVEGARRGRTIGFPTANLRCDPEACLPALGVYAGWWLWRGRRLPGVINAGMNPTFADTPEPKVEIHVFDLDEDLYGQPGEIEFARRLREERKFESVDALVDQIGRDADQARALLGRGFGGVARPRP